MNEQNGLLLLLIQFIGGVIVYVLANLRNDKRNKTTQTDAAKNTEKKTDEAKTYSDELFQQLELKITRMENEISALREDNKKKAAEIIQAQTERDAARAERDAARAENAELTRTIQGERDTFVQVSKQVEALEKEVAELRAQIGQNNAVQAAADQMLKFIHDGVVALLTELTPKPVTPAPSTPEGSAT